MYEPGLVSNTVSVQSHTQSRSELEKEPFLQFCLEPETRVLLPLQQSAEVLSISRKAIVPIFFMPAWVTGVCNLRGEILWVVDLGHLLGLTPCYQQVSPGSSATIIVLNAANSTTTNNLRNSLLGCMVSRLEAIEYCHSEQFQPPPSTATAPPFIQSYWLKSDYERLAVLDIKAMLAAMPKPIT